MAAELEHSLVARERARCDALVGDVMAGLADLLSDDLIHVHTTGIVHGKRGVLDHAERFLRFLDIERGPLDIRALGPDAAIMTGTMTNRVDRRDQEGDPVDVRAFVTQIWANEGGSWRIRSFHATRLPEQS